MEEAVEDLTAFLRARWDEDEQWALAASAPYPYADGEPGVPEAGVRWQWVEGPNWEPTRPDPAVQEFVAEPGVSCNLVSVETWPAGGRMVRRRFATEIIEMDSAAAGHIIRHDPARVLREVETKRRLLVEHPILTAARVCTRCSDYAEPGEVHREAPGPCTTVRLLALPYADHADYREEWKP